MQVRAFERYIPLNNMNLDDRCMSLIYELLHPLRFISINTVYLK